MVIEYQFIIINLHYLQSEAKQAAVTTAVFLVKIPVYQEITWGSK